MAARTRAMARTRANVIRPQSSISRSPLFSVLPLLSLILLLLLSPSHAQFWSYYDATTGTLSTVWNNWVRKPLDLDNVCPFSANFSQVVKPAVFSKVKCQDRALTILTDGLASWEMTLMKPKPKPLVLAFTGATGVGKTATALAVARAMLNRTEKMAVGEKPMGLIMLRGEDFWDAKGNVTSYVHTIKTTLFHHIVGCRGQSVVVMDEIQKVAPGTLEAFAGVIGDEHTLSLHLNGKYHQVDTSHVVFIFISDIGWDEMIPLLVAYKGKGEDIPPHLLASTVKKAMDAQWARLKFGKLIDKTVPFFPLSQAQLSEILDLKLQEMNEEHKGNLWAGMQTTKEARDYLVSSPFVKYIRYGTGDKDTQTNTTKMYEFSQFGARPLTVGGPVRLLESVFVQHMKPWRPDEVIDVQLNANKGWIELRWCPPAMSSSSSSPLKKEAHKLKCELMWAGDMKKKIG